MPAVEANTTTIRATLSPLTQQQAAWERSEQEREKLAEYIRRYHVSRAAQAHSREKALARKEVGEALSSGRAFEEEPEARRLARELGDVPR
jgi:ATPase subunit of ABC transporter with duplicated ATPase domains